MDYHQRFKEKFPAVCCENAPKDHQKEQEEILAFMEEEKRESHFQGFVDGELKSRTALIAHVEGMKRDVSIKMHGDYLDESYNQALDSILTYLQAEHTPTND